MSAIADDLARRLMHGAGAFFDLDEDPRIGRVESRVHPYSRIFRIELAWQDLSRWIYLKMPPGNPANQDVLAQRLATEFRVLDELWRRFGDGGPLGVVRPFGLYPHHLAIATVEATGTNLRHLLGRRARRLTRSSGRAALARHVEQCGAWLREFQAITAQPTGRFDDREMQEYCKVRLALLAARHPALFGDELPRDILARLREIGEAPAARDTRTSGRHNDFTAHNIVALGSGIRVLDFSMFDHGTVALDACNFWIDLETLKADPTYSARFLTELQQRFLGAYGIVTTTDPLFAAARCRYSLNRLLTILDAQSHWALAWIDRRRVASGCYDWLTEFARGRGE